ncbi:MAG: TonB-dependent receptor domain-containing protein [Vicinamibacteraceae bacterium]
MPASEIAGGPDESRNTLVAYTHTLSQRLLNDFRIGYHRVDRDNLNYFALNDITSAGAELGIPGFDADVRYGNPGIPSFTISGFTGLGVGEANWYQSDTTFQLANVLAYTRGAHNIRTGFEARRVTTSRRSANNLRGQFTFTGEMTGDPMADFLLGLPRRVTTPVDLLQAHVGGWRTGTFINDTWQASRKLTVNLGLRYERNTPVETYSGIASMTNEDQTAIVPETPTGGFQFHDANTKNFAPRVGVAYRLRERTVLRAGWGIYYNPPHMNLFTLLTTNPPQASRFTYDSDPSNPTLSLENPSGQAGSGDAPDVTTINRDLPDHRKNQWSVDIQQELWAGTVLELSYLRARTEHIDRSFLLNTPRPGPGPVDERRPNSLFNVIRYQTNDLIAEYDAVTVHLRRRMGNGLQADAHYTWSRSYDMANNSGAGATTDPYDIWADYGPANSSVPHRVVASYIYELPFFKNSPNVLARTLAAGWQVGGVTIFESGRPFSVTIQGDRANTGIGGQRADLVGPVPGLTCEDNPTGPGLINCIDPSAFAEAAEFTYGNAPRNLMHGPNAFTTDLSLIKWIPIGNRARLEVRLEAFNLFNRVNFDSPSGAFGTANFGGITSAGDMRRFELGAKLVF